MGPPHGGGGCGSRGAPAEVAGRGRGGCQGAVKALPGRISITTMYFARVLSLPISWVLTFLRHPCFSSTTCRAFGSLLCTSWDLSVVCCLYARGVGAARYSGARKSGSRRRSYRSKEKQSRGSCRYRNYVTLSFQILLRSYQTSSQIYIFLVAISVLYFSQR